jgi:hypothetical protein
MLRRVNISLIIWLGYLAMGCASHNSEDMYPPNPNCNIDNISYKGYIQPLFQDKCYSCHDQQHAKDSASGNVLDNYKDVAAHAQSGFLSATISDPDIKSTSHMPKNKPSLPDCDIRKIKAWIGQGTKDN